MRRVARVSARSTGSAAVAFQNLLRRPSHASVCGEVLRASERERERERERASEQASERVSASAPE